MEVIFYYADSARGNAQLPEILCASVREHMDVRIVHMTDDKTEPVEGADETIRCETGISLPESKLKAFASYETKNGLYLDTDTVIMRDVRGVWGDWDVAAVPTNPELKIIDAPDVFDPDEYVVKKMPFNLGVVFARDSAVWKRVLEIEQGYDIAKRRWFGDQLAFGELGGVHALPQEYNYAPSHPLEKFDCAIAHFKGPRKIWMVQRFLTCKTSMGALVDYGS